LSPDCSGEYTCGEDGHSLSTVEFHRTFVEYADSDTRDPPDTVEVHFICRDCKTRGHVDIKLADIKWY
jgi:hypothetical protein